MPRFPALLTVAVLGSIAGAVAQPPSTSVPTRSLWRATNPGGGGWFERIAAGPTGMVIACSDLSGAYRSRDRGITWDCLGRSRGLLTTHVACVAFHARDASVLYLGTEDGIYASADLGESFTHPLARGYVEFIAVAPSDARVAYAAWHPRYNSNDGQIYKTTDRGKSWRRVDTDLPRGHRILELLVAPGTPDELYLMTGIGRFARGPCAIFRSLDGGVRYTRVTPDGCGDTLSDIALDPFAPGHLYASVDSVDDKAHGVLHRSTDRGTTWQRWSDRGGYIWFDRRRRGTLRMIDSRHSFPWDPRQGVWESTEHGSPESWKRVGDVAQWDGGWSTAPWSRETIARAHGEDASDPDVLYWVGAQFVHGTFDRGRSAQQIFSQELRPRGSKRWRTRGIDNVVVLDLALSRKDPDAVYASFLDLGTWRSLDSGKTWTMINDAAATGSWAGAGGCSWTVLADPARARVVWTAQSEERASPATLLRSRNGGDSWSKAAGLPPASILGLSLDPQSPIDRRHLYCAAAGDVYASVDDGRTWSKRFANGGIRTTKVVHDRDQGVTRVYAGGESGLFVSIVSNGRTGAWTSIGTREMTGTKKGLPERSWTGVYDIVADPRVSGRVYVVVHGKGRGLYRSADHGSTWEPRVLTNDYLWCVAVDPTDSGTLYATSSSAFDSGGYSPVSRGVLRSVDDGRSWQPLNEGLAWPFAIPIAIDETDAGRVWIGSPGTGIHVRIAETLRADTAHLAAAGPTRAQFTLEAGDKHANKNYLLLASTRGSRPGIALGSVFVPLNPDEFLLPVAMNFPNTAVFVNSAGVLDAAGSARAAFAPPATFLRTNVGRELTFVYLTLGPLDLASNPVSIAVVR